MLKKFFIASLLLVLSVTVNATPIKTGINGKFDLFAYADITLNAAGEVSFIDFSPIFDSTVLLVYPGDYLGNLGRDNPVSFNSFDINASVGIELWSVNGFSFTATEVALNQTDGQRTDLTIIGDVSHDNFLTTSSKFFISAHGLNVDDINRIGLFATITSPVPEPSTLAIFALGIIAFVASRKKKSA